ncbi:MAG TPA: Stk1 family PASTA domain-containing Ser/Thr kinase [Streptosporangiaceae bacterium]|nr:Stk1 family PASTA domain-containing Ser/Thr kinase [Streptosporangiaceae bacterium]
MTQPRLLGGRYELDGVVGRGGMAEVYRARDLRLDRVVAVKTLREDLARDQTFQARFRREAQSAASLNHPSIVAVYDTGEDNAGPSHVPYIVMEYVDGRTIRDLLRDDRRLLPDRALEITDGVLRALDYSHRNGIVHRDIKPGNVMLNRSGEIKVMDFGIARAVADAQATMTQTAQVIGTAQYLSPEQARGERVDSRSDLYSVGCLLYELLTGRPPFTGDSPVAIAYQHVRENPIPPSRVDPELPSWADPITLRAMAKDPADRYQSAAEMRSDIQRALSGYPVAAAMMPTAAYGGPGTRRMDAMTGQTQFQGPTGAIPPYQYGPQDGGPPRGSRRRRRPVWPWITALVALLVIGGLILAFETISNNSTPPGVEVPTVQGLLLPKAEQIMISHGFKFRAVPKPTASGTPQQVTSTNPAGGQTAAKGSTVTIYYNAPPGSKTIPSVAGLSPNDAMALLHRQGWVNVVTSGSPVASTIPSGDVATTNPPPGTQVSLGSTIQLVLSGGGTRVPNVLNLSEADAISVLTNAGLNPVSVTNQSGPPGVSPGLVWQVKPGVGRLVLPGSSVTIYVVPGQSSPSSSPSPSTSPSTSPSSSPSPSSSGP